MVILNLAELTCDQVLSLLLSFWRGEERRAKEKKRTPPFPLALQRKREEGPSDPPVAEQNVTSLAKFAHRLLIIVFESL